MRFTEVITVGCGSLCILRIWLSFQVLVSVLPLPCAKPGLPAPHESSEQSQALVGRLDSIGTTWQVILLHRGHTKPKPEGSSAKET